MTSIPFTACRGCRSWRSTWRSAARVGAVLGSAAGFAWFAACGARDRQPPVTERQRVRILQAVQALRGDLNRLPCASILDPARESLRGAWMEGCGHIREKWGDWQSFMPSHWYWAGPAAIAVEGPAHFANGRCDVQIVWDLVTGSPRMLALFVRSKDDEVNFPTPARPRLMDPPPKRAGFDG